MKRRAQLTQADLIRALRATEKSGVKAAIEVTPEGVMRFVPLDPTDKPKRIAEKKEIVLW